jgi:hypothetical protein
MAPSPQNRLRTAGSIWVRDSDEILVELTTGYYNRRKSF